VARGLVLHFPLRAPLRALQIGADRQQIEILRRLQENQNLLSVRGVRQAEV
jgi:hypothetical protein